MSNETPKTETPVVYDSKLTHNEVAIELAQKTTEPKAGHKAVSYWSLDISSLDWAVLEKLMGKQAKAMLQSKLDTALKAAQLEGTRDIYSLTEKLGYAKRYVTSDFGASKAAPTSTMAKALDNAKKVSALQAEALTIMMSIMANPNMPVEERTKALARATELQALIKAANEAAV